MDGAIIRSGGTALDLRRLSAEELLLTLAKPVDGIVDLGNAQVSVLCDDPATWPADIRLDGFSYGSLITRAEQDRSGTDAMTYLSDSANTSAEILPARDRLVWLGRSSVGYRPQPYEQLAAFYRRMGHDDQARKVLLAKQRRRRSTQGFGGEDLGLPARLFYRLWIPALAGSNLVSRPGYHGEHCLRVATTAASRSSHLAAFQFAGLYY